MNQKTNERPDPLEDLARKTTDRIDDVHTDNIDLDATFPIILSALHEAVREKERERLGLEVALHEALTQGKAQIDELRAENHELRIALSQATAPDAMRRLTDENEKMREELRKIADEAETYADITWKGINCSTTACAEWLDGIAGIARAAIEKGEPK